MGLQRHLKVLGIFARINYRDGKPHYLADTPRFVGYVRVRRRVATTNSPRSRGSSTNSKAWRQRVGYTF